MNSELRYEQILSKIKKRGCRMTSHRVALLRLIAASEGHPSAQGLYEQLKAQFPTISLATVYKTLSLLKEEGEVLEIDLHDDSHYDGNKPFPHPHLVCTRCRRILDADALFNHQQISQQIADTLGFQVTRQQIVFYGICPECQSKSG